VRVVKSIRMRFARHEARMVRREECTGCWWGKHKRKRPLGRPKFRWEDNIKMNVQEFGGGRGEWIKLAQDRDG
jgi:hypothetical protein